MRDAKGRFVPGESGNPLGRPTRSDYLTEALEAVLREPMPKDEKRTLMEALIRRLVKSALAGNLTAIQYLWDRVEGKPVTRLRQEGNPQEAAWLQLLGGMFGPAALKEAVNGDE